MDKVKEVPRRAQWTSHQRTDVNRSNRGAQHSFQRLGEPAAVLPVSETGDFRTDSKLNRS